jgi:hypothetical protein
MSTTITAKEIQRGDTVLRNGVAFSVTKAQRLAVTNEIKVYGYRPEFDFTVENIKCIGRFAPDDTVERED